MNIAVIGAGIMGRYTARALALSPQVQQVCLYDKKLETDINFIGELEKFLSANGDLENSRDYSIQSSVRSAVNYADILLFCVETDNVGEAMREVLPYARRGAIISGQTSRKTPEAEVFDDYVGQNPDSGLEMVSIHTLCNPSSSDPSKQILGIIRHRASDASYRKAYDLFSCMSENISEFESVDEHDTTMAHTQINTSKTWLSIASSFARAGRFPWIDGVYGSGMDAMKFAMALRAAKAAPHIYRNIQLGSPHGKSIVEHSAQVEYELFRLIVGDNKEEYRRRCMDAKEALYGSRSGNPMLSDGEVQSFGNGNHVLPNSHFSIMQYAVSSAENPDKRRRNLFADLRGTTPMHTSLILLADYLFNNQELLEDAINAPFGNPKLRSDDLVFHDEIQGWSDAVLFDNSAGFNARHKKMTGTLDSRVVGEQSEKSSEIVRLGTEALSRAKMSGRIEELLETA